MFHTDDCRQLVRCLHTVLQGDHHRIGSNERAHRLGGFLYLPGLHANEDRINDANVLGAVSRLGRRDDGITFITLDMEAVFTDRL